MRIFNSEHPRFIYVTVCFLHTNNKGAIMKLSKKLLIGILSILPLSVFAHTQNITIEGDHGKLSAIMRHLTLKATIQWLSSCMDSLQIRTLFS